MKHCIHEPDDACIDCSPNCPNSETFGKEEFEPCLVCGCAEPDPDGFCPQCEIAMEIKKARLK